jgi:hypothetical protein
MVGRCYATVVLLSLSALLPAPAFGWELGTVGAQTFWTGVRDVDGKTQLVFFCSQATPGIVQLQVFTPEPGPANAVPAELFFTTGDGSFGPVAARATSLDGNLTIATSGMDLAAMNAVQSIYDEGGSVTLQYNKSIWHYPGADHSGAFGAMLDACG